MSTPHVVRAVQLKVAGLTPGDFPGGVVPAAYFDEAPVTGGSGSQVQVTTQGYLVLKNKSAPARLYAFGGDTREDVGLDIEVYYPELGDCQTAAGALRAALNYGTLPDLDGGVFKLLAVRPVGSQQAFAGVGKTGANVHQVVLSYRIELVRFAA